MHPTKHNSYFAFNFWLDGGELDFLYSLMSQENTEQQLYINGVLNDYSSKIGLTVIETFYDVFIKAQINVFNSIKAEIEKFNFLE